MWSLTRPSPKHTCDMNEPRRAVYKTDLEVNHLKSLVSYDPETGLFRWKKNRGGTARSGELAGCRMANGYWKISIGNRPFLGHRLAWFYQTGSWPDCQIDHVNGVRDDNRFSNLRQSTHTENARNHGSGKRNKSGCVGVFWLDKPGKWWAYIHYNRKNVNLGKFDTYDEAVAARKHAESELYKEFARC